MILVQSSIPLFLLAILQLCVAFQLNSPTGLIYNKTKPRSQLNAFVDVAPNPKRRSLFSSVHGTGLSIILLGLNAGESAAEEKGVPSASSQNLLLEGTVTLQDNIQLKMGPDTALYVTARPDKPDNVPMAILNGTRGKPPPVLVAKFVNLTQESFPFEFRLSHDELTDEGAAGDKEGGSFWWGRDNLIVSARLDIDGVATTRDPEDLVGRGLLVKGGRNGDDRVEIQLQGRGKFGKFATAKSKK